MQKNIRGIEITVSKQDKLKKQLISFSRRSGAQGWCPGTLGNISALDPKATRFFIKKTGADLGKLRLEDVLTLNAEGSVIEGRGKPSIETNFHIGIYRARKDVGAVFHVHPPFATAFAVKGTKIPMVTEAAKILLIDIPIVPQAPAGSTQLAEKVTKVFSNPHVKALLIKNHGLVAVGETLEGAYQICALVEDTAKVAFLSSLIPD